MPNIIFNYMYRDAGNNKNRGEAIFSNPDNVNLAVTEKILRSKLIDGENFYVDQLDLKDLHFTIWHNDIDHTWHEFVSLELTDEPTTETKTFKQFLKQIPVQK